MHEVVQIAPAAGTASYQGSIMIYVDNLHTDESLASYVS